MHVTVVSPEQGVFDGSADAIVAPAYDGQVGILPGHAPFLTLLGTGVLQVRHGSASTRFRVAGGFLQVVGAGGGGGGGGGGGTLRNGAGRVEAPLQIPPIFLALSPPFQPRAL